MAAKKTKILINNVENFDKTQQIAETKTNNLNENNSKIFKAFANIIPAPVMSNMLIAKNQEEVPKDNLEIVDSVFLGSKKSSIASQYTANV